MVNQWNKMLKCWRAAVSWCHERNAAENCLHYPAQVMQWPLDYNSYCYIEGQSRRSPVFPSIIMSLQKVGNNIVRTSKMLDSSKCLVQFMSGKTNNTSICSFSYQFKIAGFNFWFQVKYWLHNITGISAMKRE